MTAHPVKLSPDDLDDLTMPQLQTLVARGIITVTMTPLPKSDLPEYKQFDHLQGETIHISAAARKYTIPQQTISRWVTRGLIRVAGTEKNRRLLDAQDMAYCAYIYHRDGGARRRGVRLFNADGTPYTRKTKPPMAA